MKRCTPVLFFLLSLFILNPCHAEDSRERSPYYTDGKFHNIAPPKVELSAWVYFTKVKGKGEDWPDVSKLPYEKFPLPAQKLAWNEVRITHIFHATVLIQMNGLNILTDPVWSERASPFTWMGPKRARPSAFTLEELPPIDVILISHNHYDHMDIATLKKLEAKHHPLVLTGLGNLKYLKKKGLKNVVELDWFEEAQKIPLLDTADLKVFFAPAQHFAARSFFDKKKSLWGSFIL